MGGAEPAGTAPEPIFISHSNWQHPSGGLAGTGPLTKAGNALSRALRKYRRSQRRMGGAEPAHEATRPKPEWESDRQRPDRGLAGNRRLGEFGAALARVQRDYRRSRRGMGGAEPAREAPEPRPVGQPDQRYPAGRMGNAGAVHESEGTRTFGQSAAGGNPCGCKSGPAESVRVSGRSTPTLGSSANRKTDASGRAGLR